ncbi:SURF1 family cytochrome oxidase biogenesis protein [Hyphobacterium sp.]|uniref:SURF1 family cytochrome oxidase biogenesis protein n=1 Tax=Hyphobacterium sp. TaxID=2004662 RepID=UPI003B52B04D
MLPALALLLWLGAWQWGRMGDKADAVAAWESRETGAALPLSGVLCDVRASYFGQEVELPDPANREFIRFQGRSLDGEPGWRHMYALPLPDCFEAGAGQSVLVQHGFEPLRGGDVVTTERLMIRPPPETGGFAAENDTASRTFYRFEPESLAQSLDSARIYADFWIVGYSDELPPELAAVPPVQHLGYALTWWGMALALIAVYLGLHVQRRRLCFTRR